MKSPLRSLYPLESTLQDDLSTALRDHQSGRLEQAARAEKRTQLEWHGDPTTRRPPGRVGNFFPPGDRLAASTSNKG